MVKVEGEKMSKSLGNFITIRDLLAKFEPMAVRLFILQAHYRKPLDFTDEALQAATNGWQTLKEGLLFGQKYGQQLGWEISQSVTSVEAIRQQFQNVVDDDFNFAAGLAVLFDLAKELRKEANVFTHEGKTISTSIELQQKWCTLSQLGDVFGFETQLKENTVVENTGPSDQEIEALIAQRSQARQAKNFAEADRLREQLQEAGITLIDRPGGITKWHSS